MATTPPKNKLFPKIPLFHWLTENHIFFVAPVFVDFGGVRVAILCNTPDFRENRFANSCYTPPPFRAPPPPFGPDLAKVPGFGGVAALSGWFWGGFPAKWADFYPRPPFQPVFCQGWGGGGSAAKQAEFFAGKGPPFASILFVAGVGFAPDPIAAFSMIWVF